MKSVMILRKNKFVYIALSPNANKKKKKGGREKKKNQGGSRDFGTVTHSKQEVIVLVVNNKLKPSLIPLNFSDFSVI